ncbi:uncharacterized protein LOC116433048 isoform X2 [Nomia melanderi]|uniref:uncharacterized protein LOC116433048 isoform X2 n=1 Tax=Nomia melanderi TaxID=2448451 RepID=UPI003FCE1479
MLDGFVNRILNRATKSHALTGFRGLHCWPLHRTRRKFVREGKHRFPSWKYSYGRILTVRWSHVGDECIPTYVKIKSCRFSRTRSVVRSTSLSVRAEHLWPAVPKFKIRWRCFYETRKEILCDEDSHITGPSSGGAGVLFAPSCDCTGVLFGELQRFILDGADQRFAFICRMPMLNWCILAGIWRAGT